MPMNHVPGSPLRMVRTQLSVKVNFLEAQLVAQRPGVPGRREPLCNRRTPTLVRRCHFFVPLDFLSLCFLFFLFLSPVRTVAIAPIAPIAPIGHMATRSFAPLLVCRLLTGVFGTNGAATSTSLTPPFVEQCGLAGIPLFEPSPVLYTDPACTTHVAVTQLHFCGPFLACFSAIPPHARCV